ncbi:hypothetical protein Tco_0994755 [Tanacetum coccineum]
MTLGAKDLVKGTEVSVLFPKEDLQQLHYEGCLAHLEQSLQGHVFLRWVILMMISSGGYLDELYIPILSFEVFLNLMASILSLKSNIQGVCGALDGAVSPPDDKDTAKLVKLVQIGPYGELDGVVSPPDELDTPKLVKLDNISGPSGKLDGTSTLSDGQDTTKTVETNLNLAAKEIPSSQRNIVLISCFVVTLLK